jgi:hypothetical protein
MLTTQSLMGVFANFICNSDLLTENFHGKGANGLVSIQVNENHLIANLDSMLNLY